MTYTARLFGFWVVCVVATTGAFACIYFATQQQYRQSFNDPQIQMAEDAAAIVRGGGIPPDLTKNDLMVDVGLSLSPWLALYDEKGTPIASSALLHDAPPQPPLGLFDDSTWTFEKVYDFNGMKETRVTWEDSHGTRQAIVIVHVQAPKNEFVVAGRNMRVVEDHIRDISTKILFAWAFTCLAVLAAIAVLLKMRLL